MADVSSLVDDALLLANYALTRGIALPNSVTDVLLRVSDNREKLAGNDPERIEFYKAMQCAITTIGKSIPDILAEKQRVIRLRPLVAEAEQLLKFATTNGRKIDDDIRNQIITTMALMDIGTPTSAQEQVFLKAYEGITFILSPITAETLKASTVQFPGWTSWKTDGGNVFTSWFISRFFNVAAFGAMLLMTCVALGYYYQGTSSLSRLKELQDVTAKLEIERALREAAVDLAMQTKLKVAGDATAAQKALTDAEYAVVTVRTELSRAGAELDAIPERLYKWASSPCEEGAFWIAELALCSEADQKAIKEEREAKKKANEQERKRAEERVKSQSATGATPQTSIISDVVSFIMPFGPRPFKYAQVEQARTVASRLSDVYLPLMLGWLGAHAFVLRRMSKDIMARSLARGSGFNHVARIGLGALAGLASTWLLTPEYFGTLLTAPEAAPGGQFKKLPVWGLAFVAGYGIELVFALMDRILGAFTNRESGPAHT
jgi:hypothetical protein